jgi:RNA polymerase sigma-70 factor, ECF subfamily
VDQSRTYKPEDAAFTVATTDEQLMHATQQGDHHAYWMLMRRYERPLFNFIRRMIGPATDAEDLVQEVFLRVYRHRDRFRAGKPFRPWLYGIATNRCKDFLRYQRHRRHASLQAPVSNNPDAAVLGDAIADTAPGPDALAQAGEMRARLEAALQALPLKHRTVFLMARYDGLPYLEIARALRIPVGTVKSRMNKAVRILLAAVEEDAP